MAYSDWFYAHAQKHRRVMEKLSELTEDEVIAYFRFDRLKANEPDFCPLFADDTKCHDTARLNCYFCACPHFRFNDEGFVTIEGKTLYSYCAIDSKDGKRFESRHAIHQDCSGCTVPHQEAFIAKHFTRQWLEAMRRCDGDKVNLKDK